MVWLAVHHGLVGKVRGRLRQGTHLLFGLAGSPRQVITRVMTKEVVRVGERVGDEFRQ